MGLVRRKEGIERIDTNVILRLILNDNPSQVKKVKKLFYLSFGIVDFTIVSFWKVNMSHAVKPTVNYHFHHVFPIQCIKIFCRIS